MQYRDSVRQCCSHDHDIVNIHNGYTANEPAILALMTFDSIDTIIVFVPGNESVE